MVTGGLSDVVTPGAPVIAQEQRILGPIVKVASQVHLAPDYIFIVRRGKSFGYYQYQMK